MTINELIEELEIIQEVHPEAQVMEARTVLGKKSNHVALRLKDHIILIEGIKA